MAKYTKRLLLIKFEFTMQMAGKKFYQPKVDNKNDMNGKP